MFKGAICSCTNLNQIIPGRPHLVLVNYSTRRAFQTSFLVKRAKYNYMTTRARGRSRHQQGRPSTELQKLQEPEVIHAAHRDVLLLSCRSYVYKLLPYCVFMITYTLFYTIWFSVSCAHTLGCIFVMYDVKTSS